MAEGSAVAVQAYLQLNGLDWKLLEDGSLVPLAPGESRQPGVPVLDPPETTDQADLPSSSSSQSSLATFFSNITREGRVDIPESGYTTRGLVDVGDSDRQTPNGPPPDLLPNDAAIGIRIDDGGDGYINQFEQSAVDLVGTSSGIADDTTVDVVVIDSLGNTLTFQAIVQNDQFTVVDADLSSLEEGPLVAVATYADPYGNRVTGGDNSIKDTLASGQDIDADTGADDVVNAVEAVGNTLSGSFANVQAGADVEVTVSGAGNGDLVFTTTLDANGNWSIPDVDLDVFDDGTLTLSASTVDQAGNPASITDTVEMDTLATVTAVFIDPQQPDGVAGYLNQVEGDSASVSGTVTGVEDGQTVTVVISDGNGGSLTFDALVSGGIWQVDNQDLSTLQPGQLTLDAIVQDQAGNRATASDTILYDPIAEIPAPITSSAGRILNAAEVSGVDFSGTVNDVESGRDVAITITDNQGMEVTGTVQVDASGNWSLVGADVSGLADGLLQFSVTTTDIAGNEATRDTLFFKDTQNNLTAEFVDQQTPDGVGGYYNAAEVANLVTLQGTADAIFNGRPVTVTVTDSAGNTVTVPGVTISGGTWQATGVDLSSLVPGDITLTAATQDLSGNPAFAVDDFIYDPNAAINDDLTGPALDDGTFNKAEIDAGVTLTGTVTDIEPGRELALTIDDGQGGLFTDTVTIAADGSWTLSNADLSALADGTLTVTLTGTDIAGNPAAQSTDFLKDTLASGVTITAVTGTDAVVNAVEAVDNTLSGTFADVQAGATVEVTVSGAGNPDLVFQTTLDASGNWSVADVDLDVFDDGTLTLTATTVDQAGNPAAITDTVELDTQAAITAVFIDPQQPDGIDGYLNAVEGAAASFSGTVTGVENGQLVTVTVTDQAGVSLTFGATANGGTWQVADQDLSSLQPGELTLNASVEDQAGNPASASDTIIYDPIAEIPAPITADAGRILNAAEVGAVDFSGTVNDVEVGRELSITVTDKNGVPVSGTAVVDASGNWALNDVDVSGLADGVLDFSVTTTDIAGNEVTRDTLFYKDTQNKLTAEFVDQQTPDGVGGYYNSAEVANLVTLQGTADAILNGRDVTVTVRDSQGNEVSVAGVTISGGTWQATDVDLSSLVPGDISLIATSEDASGNPAFASDDFIYDPVAEIPAPITSNAGRILNAAEVGAVDFSGTVNDVESGRDVFITISDGQGGEVTATVQIDASGNWSLGGADVSGLADGVLNFSVSTTDIAGNEAVRDTQFLKDTVNDLTAEFVDQQTPDGVGGYYNKVEADGGVTLRGDATNIVDGAAITVTVRDSEGNEVSVPGVTASGGTWEATNVDLTSLVPGEITLTASSVDISGNPAFAADTFIYDPNATINDDVTGPALDDDTFNKVEIAAGVTLTGTVTDIEPDRDLAISIDDGQGGLFTDTVTIAADGSWTLSNAELSTLADGTLTVTLTGTDIAGNPATETTTVLKDTLATGISITADTGADAVLNNDEAPDTVLSGSFADVQAGATVDITVSDGVNPDQSYQATLDASGNWSVPNADLSGFNDGDLTLTAQTVDQAGNPASITDTVLKDTSADITALYDDPQQPENIAGYLNAVEGQSASFGGTVTGIEDGQPVAITITDINNATQTFSATVSGGAWQVNGANLSSLAQGALLLSVVAEDAAGNEATATDSIVYDPVAQLVADIAADAGSTVNAAEVGDVDFSGSVVDVESGRDVTITLSDSGGNSVDGTATIAADGTWLLADVDLTGLNDGPITLQANTTDEAGNPAVQTASFVKDTQAQLTAEFVDEQVPDGVGGYYNASEFPTVTLQGTAPQVEDGQTVTVTVEDAFGNVVNVPGVTVSGELWQAPDVDLSSLQQGDITLTATVTDQAGNTATATDTFIYDPVAVINNDLASPALDDGVLNAAEVAAGVSFTGTVTDIESGRTLDVLITDQGGGTFTDTVTIAADGSWSLDNADLSGLSDGTLTMTLTGTDIAGNEAEQTFTFDKDTLATLTARFEDAQVFEGFTGILNDAEDNATVLSGTVNNVEVGDTVFLTVTDANNLSLDFQATVQPGGTWSTTEDLSSLAPGTLTLNATTTDDAGNPASASATIEHDPNATITVTSLDQGDVINAQEAPATVVNGTVVDVEAGRTIQVEITDGVSTVTTTAVVQSDLSWAADPADLSSLADGPLTIDVSVFDQAGNEATNSYAASKDATAEITVMFEDDFINDGFGGYLNADEDDITTVSGVVTDVEDGQTVQITLTDSIGATMTGTADVAGGAWSLADVDLSGLAEGPLTVDVSVQDSAGNVATASDDIIHDTLAAIDDTVNVSAGMVINAAEATSVSLSGNTTDIEAGRPLAVEVFDGTDTLTFNTTVASDGSWTLSNLDLSSLDDGTLTVTLSSDDRAGNADTAIDTVDKDTQAQVTVEFIDDADPTLGPNGEIVYNAAGVGSVNLQGTVIGVEDNQAVSIVLTDSAGNQVTVPDATVSGGGWSAGPVDLSGFVDGAVTVAVSTADLAGNPATASSTADIDLGVAIDIDTGPDGLPLTQFLLGQVDELSGTTTAEDGQAVTVTLSDGTLTKTFTGAVSGGTWTVPIDAADLSRQVQWTLNAQVQDLAGNMAADATPTLVEPQVMVVAENQLAAFGISRDEGDIRIQDADEVSLSSSQDKLASILSEGQAVTVNVAGDGQSLTVVRTDGTTVMTITLTGEGDGVSVALTAPVDQRPGLDRSLLHVNVDATQNDADGTSETLAADVFIVVHDSRPFTVDDTGSVVEGETGSGNLFDNDLVLEQPFTLQSINVDGTDYSVAFGSPAVVSTDKGTLTVYQNGSWSLDANRNLDHQQVQELPFTYTASDADGDTSTSDVVITVNDGAAGIVNSDDGAISEAVINQPNQPGTVVTIEAGSDDLDADTARFFNDAGQQESLLNDLGLTSLGEALTYQVAADGSSVTAMAGGVVVFVATLNATAQANGDLEVSLQMDLRRPLDHLGSEQLNLPFAVIATDTDGTDAQPGLFQLEIDDGQNPALVDTTGASVDEEALASQVSVSAQGNVDVAVGSDGIVSLGFAGGSSQPELSSGGVELQYQLSGDGQTLTAYTDDVNNPVFVATLQDAVSPESDSQIGYDFTLYQALDQVDGNGNRLDPLPVPLRLRTQDSDGDVVTLNLGIEVSDAGDPSEVIVDTLDVTEIPAKDGENLMANDSVDVEITASRDPVVEVAFQTGNGSPVMDAGGQPVTQNGAALQWYVANDQTLEARVNGQTVLRFTLPGDVEIAPGTTASVPLNLEILGPVDHLSDDLLSLTVPVAAIDADGSTALADATVNISDGHDPVTIPSDPGQVDEDGLENGASPEGQASLGLQAGSDQVVTTSVSLTSALTSGGLAVTLASAANADGWWVAQTGTGDPVFQIRVNTDGSSTLQLLGPLDHPQGDNTRDAIDVAFQVAVTDADGDVSNSGPLMFEVADDIPENVTEERTITEGDDITGNLLSDPNTTGADGGALTQVTYRNVDYSFDTDPITITLTDATGAQYGVMTLHSDGNFTVDTDEVFNFGGVFDTDNMQAVVTDGDGDVANLNLLLNVRDADGTVVVQPVEGNEDTPLIVDLRADPGDQDQGDLVTLITFDMASLEGGSLFLDGVALPVGDDGNPFLMGANLLRNADGVAVPNGELTFVPALNSSLQTENPVLQMDVLVSLSSGATRDFSDSAPIIVHSVADAPLWDAPSSDVSINEDGPASALNLSADLVDEDGSEVLSYRIDSIESGLILELNGEVLATGDTLTRDQFASLTVRAQEGVAGNYQFDVTAIATEKENGDIAQTPHTVNVAVTPVADIPDIRSTGSLSELEDAQIDVARLVDASLNDVDGSETLQLQLDVPEGWSVIGQNGAVVMNPDSGRYLADWSDVQAGNVLLIPKQDISSVSVPGGSFPVQITAIATESEQDGLAPNPVTAESDPVTVNISLTGVVDDPLFTPDNDGAWAWNGDVDNSVITGTLDEDGLLSLSFMLGSSDIDGSERSDLVIGNLDAAIQLVDINGDPVSLQVVGENAGGLIYQISAEQLADIYVRPQQDFSGEEPAFSIRQVISEPDGDSASFAHSVVLDNLPVVDTQDGENIVTVGVEDNLATLNLLPSLLDSDGSETLTGLVILDSGEGQLMLDGQAISVPSGGLDLGQLAQDEGITLTELATSGRLTWQPPEDGSGLYSVPISYQITDTANNGVQAVSDYTGNLQVDVAAQVDVDAEDLPTLTRLEGSDTVLSGDQNGLDLSSAVQFVEDDIDGSETLDYIVISMPAAEGWYVEHPNGAVHDGNGNWLIPATGLSSDSVVEDGTQLLAGLTLYSETATGVETILVQTRVLDGDDAEMINIEVQVQFSAGNTGTATQVDELQNSIIDGAEGETVETSGHLNEAAAGDSNDAVSFRVDAGDLPPGAAIAGTGVQVLHASDGKTVIEYVFTQAALGDLTIVGIDEDIAGAISIPVTSISTDPSGDTVTSLDSLDIELAPVVDDINDAPGIDGLEDIATALNVDLNSLLNDRSTDGSEGLESIQSVRFLALPEGSFVDPDNLLVDNNDGTFTLSDPSRISDIYFLPPQHLSGTFGIDMELEVLDQVSDPLTVVSNTDTQTVPASIGIDVAPITDPGTVTAVDVTGAEDADIALGDLQAELVDQDGSETLTVVLKGVPTDAVILVDGVPVANNGPDGGSLFGEPTFQWSLSQADLANAVIRPPANFSGDIPLTLEAVTIETGTDDVRTVSQDFTVFVNPVGDGVEFNGADVSASGQEGDDVTIAVNAKTLEPDYVIDGHPRDGNEGMVLTVQVADTSQATALLGLEGIRVGDRTVSFQQVGGVTVAVMALSASELADGHLLESFELLTGPLAFGNLDLNIRIASTDQAVVNGETVNAISPPQLQQVSVQLTALPDAPDVDLGFDNFYVEAGTGDVPLSIDVQALNPAPGEEATLIVEGVPDTMQLSAGTQVDGHWEVPADQVPGLALVNPGSVGDFTLTVYGRAELDGETAEGSQQTLDVSVHGGGATVVTGTQQSDWLAGGGGDDTLTGGAGADSFVFRQADLLGATSDTADTITDFSVEENDRLDLSDLLAGTPATNGEELDAVIDIQDNGTSVVFTISPDGQAVSQIVTLDNTSETELFGGDVSGLTEAEMLQQLLDNQVLIT